MDGAGGKTGGGDGGGAPTRVPAEARANCGSWAAGGALFLQQGGLGLRQPAIAKLPGMEANLLPIQVTHLQHPKPGKKRIRMIPAPYSRHKAHKSLLGLKDLNNTAGVGELTHYRAER